MVDENPTGGEGSPRVIQVQKIQAEKSIVRDMRVERFNAQTGEALDGQSDLLVEIWNILDDQTKTLQDELQDISNSATDIVKAIGRSQREQIAAIDKLTREFKAMKGFGGGAGGGSGGTGGGAATPPPPPSAPASAVAGVSSDLVEELSKLRRAIEVSATQAAVEATAEGGGRGGRDFADVRAAEEQINRFRKIMDGKVLPTLGDMAELFKSGVVTTVTENMNRFALAVQNAGERLADLGNVTGFFRDKFSTYLDLTAAGLADFQDVMFGDLLPGLLLGRDNLKDTFQSVRNAIQSDLVSPLGFFGTEITDVADTFLDLRRTLRDQQGFDIYDRMGFREANDAMIALFDTEKRANRLADIRDSETQTAIAKQLGFLDLIAQNTGHTVEELIKATQQDRRTIADLRASGILSDSQAEGFNRLIQYFRNTGRGTIAETVLQVARAGGSVEAFLGGDTQAAQGFAATNNVNQLRALVNMANQGRMGDEAFMELSDTIAKGFQDNAGFLGIAGGQVLSQTMQQILGEAGLSRDDIIKRRGGDESTVAGLYRRLEDWFTNYIPSSSVMMTAALVANTVALGINTAALIGRGGGMIGGIGKGLGKGFGATAGAVKGMGRFLGGGLKAILKKLPIIGLGAGLLFGASRAMAGDFTGAGLEVASGLASTVPGLGTAASVALDAGLMARDAGAFNSGSVVGPSAMAVPAPQGGHGTASGSTIMLLQKQNDHLEEIIRLMSESNDIAVEVRRNTGRIGLGERGLVSAAIALFSGDEG